ncbi:MAG: DUF2236 domain-containing protein [Solirubrobacterales bacterium]|nr:DUF2236 domain-containing protein [Solirubrobacterales bacterium]
MDSYFDDTAIIRRVHREHVVALGGPRALLMQAAHPVAFAGFFASTRALPDPYPRLERTAAVLDTIVFGRREDADRATARVRYVHRRVRGRLLEPAGRFPAGTRWTAEDPDLLLWILGTLAQSSLLVFERYVSALSPGERDDYWRDYRVIGPLFGLREQDMPARWQGLSDYLGAMLAGDTLWVSPQARELGVQIVLHPPVPLAARPLLELANFVTVGLLPARLRRQYGLRWDPVRGLVHWGGAQYTRRILVPLLPERLRWGRRPALAT